MISTHVVCKTYDIFFFSFCSSEFEDDEAYLTANDEFGGSYENVGKIMSLEQKHEEGRRQVDAIKRSMGLLK